MLMAEVEMYAADWCPFCQRAQSLLDKKGVEYRRIDVDEVEGAREEMMERGGGHTIPQIFIDDEPIGGSDELQALEEKGELDTLLAGATA